MDARIEGTIEIIAALFVLACAMWDSLISIAVSIINLGSFGVFRLAESEK